MATENLTDAAAIEKLKSLVDNIDICLFCTDINNGALHAVPMSRQEVDDAGTIWFLGNAESDTCKNIEKDNQVSLQFAKVSDYEFLTVAGTASVSRDQARIDKYWNKFMEAWFEKGNDDPTIRVIEVKPSDAQFWETKDGKMLTMLKIAASAITGKSFDTGNEGNLNL